MKYICLALFIGLIGCGGKVSMTPAAPISFPIKNNCTASAPCDSFNIYRLSGICPSDLTTSAGWTLIDNVPNSITIYTDSSTIAGQTYSYDVEGVRSGQTFSGPSDCYTGSS